MSLADFCVRRPAFTTVLVMSLVVTGLFSFRDLSVDLLPKADPATVTVAVALPGASPDEMSSSVAEPLEQALSGIAGIDQIQSRLTVGSARITIRFVLERDINEAAQDVREKVAGALGKPATAGSSPGRREIGSGITADLHDRGRRAVRPSHALGDLRQEHPPRPRSGQRCRRSDGCGRPGSRDPRHARYREAFSPRVERRPGPRGDRSRERRDPWRTYRSGRRRSDAADAGASRAHRGVRQDRGRHSRRHADSRIGRRGSQRHARRSPDGGVSRWRTSGRHRRPAAIRPEHHRRHQGDQGGLERDPAPGYPPT